MLSLLPQFLFLSPVAITLIRLTVAIMLLLSAGKYLAGSNFNVVKIVGIVSGIAGLLLIVGAYSQAAAIVGAFVFAAAKTRFIVRSPFSEDAQWLVRIMSLALIATGAGAFAFDLPL